MTDKPFEEAESNLIKWIKEIGNGNIADNDLEKTMNITID